MKITTLLFAIALYSFSVTTFGQPPVRVGNPPIRIDKLSASRITIPAGIKILDATEYLLTVSSSGIVTVNLFGAKGQLIGNAEIRENQADGSYFFKYWDHDDEVWLNSVMSRSGDEMLLSATSSSGSSVRSKAKLDIAKKTTKAAIFSISIESSDGWSEFRFTKSLRTDITSEAQSAFLKAEALLLNTPGLLKLGEFMRGFGELRQLTLRKWQGGAESNPCSTQVLSPSLIDGQIELELGSCSGTAYCQRLTVLFPVFYCFSTNSSCSGAFIIQDYVLYPGFMANCSYLWNCV
jgi:hypothetical protein